MINIKDVDDNNLDQGIIDELTNNSGGDVSVGIEDNELEEGQDIVPDDEPEASDSE